jgi:phage baseplate assembly protein W
MAKEIVEIYSDLSYNPILNQLGDLTTVVNQDSVKQSIRTIINTPKGSRIFEPDFGCNMNFYLFEPFIPETGMKIGKDIEFNITTYEPRVELISIKVSLDSENEGYSVNIVYKVREIQKVDTVTIELQRL